LPIHFISDLHLQPDRPGLTDVLLHFLGSEQARGSEGLYVLGDLFEYWIGDDLSIPDNREVIDAFRELSDKGTPVYFMHGNRDFLLGEEFVSETGGRLLPDPSVIDLRGERTLLMHGDTLCTDDTAYQAFRRQVRDPENQKAFLALPPEHRRQIATGLRSTSQSAQSEKSMDIMDVNKKAVNECMQKHGVQRLIHGHTHRPATHRFQLNGEEATRIVLTDWKNDRGGVLECDDHGCVEHPLY